MNCSDPTTQLGACLKIRFGSGAVQAGVRPSPGAAMFGRRRAWILRARWKGSSGCARDGRTPEPHFQTRSKAPEGETAINKPVLLCVKACRKNSKSSKNPAFISRWSQLFWKSRHNDDCSITTGVHNRPFQSGVREVFDVVEAAQHSSDGRCSLVPLQSIQPAL